MVPVGFQSSWHQNTVFWDRQGTFLIDFLTRGETVNAECYCETLQKLWWAIQNKQHGILSAGEMSCCPIMLGHTWLDDQHISCRTSGLRCLILHSLARNLCPVISIISYSLRNFCPVSVFKMIREVEKSVTQWFQLQAEDFYDTGIEKLPPQYDKGLISRGEYVEK